MSRIERESIADKMYFYSKWLYNSQESKYISNTWDIVEGKVLKEKPTGDEREGCIFWSRDFDYSGEFLWSVEDKHREVQKIIWSIL